MPYVRVVRAKHIRKGGVQQSYYKGDWVNVGKQTALAWLADGSAEVPGPDPTKMAASAGRPARSSGTLTVSDGSTNCSMRAEMY